jgi:hypothetical protein
MTRQCHNLKLVLIGVKIGPQTCYEGCAERPKMGGADEMA